MNVWPETFVFENGVRRIKSPDGGKHLVFRQILITKYSYKPRKCVLESSRFRTDWQY